MQLSVAEDLVAPVEPVVPAILVEHGVRFEDDPLVRRFLSGGVRCGVVDGEPFYVTVFDLMRLRTLGLDGLKSNYEVRRRAADQFDYIEVRVEIRQNDGSPPTWRPAL